MEISDGEVLQQLFDPTNVSPAMLADVQWAYATDTNGGSYSGGQIKFKMTAQSEIRDMHNAYLSIPIHIESRKASPGGSVVPSTYYGFTTPANEWNLFNPITRPKIAFKNGAWDLVQGVTFNTDKGTNMVNESAGQTIPINAFRRDIEHNQLYATADGAGELYKIDEFPWSSSSPAVITGGNVAFGTAQQQALYMPGVFDSSAVPSVGGYDYDENAHSPYWEYLGTYPGSQAGQAAPSQTGIQPNPFFNRGFFEKVNDLYNKCWIANGDGASQNSGAADVALEADIEIPLREIHDLFMQWRLPSVNIGFDLTFNIPWTNPSNPSAYFPLMTDGFTIQPTIRIGNMRNNACRLFYRQCTLSAADNTTFGKMLEQGFTREIKFTTTDIVTNPSFSLGTTNYQETINQSVVNPQRVVGLLKTPTQDAGAYFYGSTSHFHFQQVNIDVNNQPAFIQPFTGDYMQYQVVREQMMPETASALPFQTWKFMKRYCVFDLTRMGNRLQSPGTAVSLRVNGVHIPFTSSWTNSTTNTALTAVWLVESKSTLIVNYSKSGVQIVVGKYNRQA